jgi:hypothetical protein
VKSACEPLVEYLLFSGEPKVIPHAAEAIAASAFAKNFAARGPKDSRGRSLRDFDGKTRLLRYPCSYLIYSASFDELPDVAMDYVARRMWEVLGGKDTTKEFAHLSSEDRRAILEILHDTKPGLARRWTH